MSIEKLEPRTPPEILETLRKLLELAEGNKISSLFVVSQNFEKGFSSSQFGHANKFEIAGQMLMLAINALNS